MISMALKICIKILHSKTEYTKMVITTVFKWLDDEWFLFLNFNLQNFSIKIKIIYTIRKQPNCLYVVEEPHFLLSLPEAKGWL